MTLWIKNSSSNKYFSCLALQLEARNRILLGRLGADDLKLDKYLQDTYKQGLKLTCLKIINNAKFYYSIDREDIIIKIPNKKLEAIARLIMYGNRDLPSSNILRVAFGLN